MKPHGTYRLTGSARRRGQESTPPAVVGALRAQRIVDSLRDEVTNNAEIQGIRVRQVFSRPREMFPVEFEAPGMKYQRTTLIDRDALEELLEVEEVSVLIRGPID
jgi:hypothetical protein